MQNADGEQRIYFLDNLRSFIILLVVVFHASMAYMPNTPRWWYVIDSQKSLFFDFFVLVNDVFMMPVMFFVAGYFAVKSLLRTGTARFVRDKIARLVIPWVFGVVFLAPAITYFIYITRSKTPPNYVYYWFNLFFGEAYQQAHYWFLGALALFCLVLSGMYHLRWLKLTPLRAEPPSASFFLCFILAGSIGFFVVNTMVNDYAWVNVKYIFLLQPTRLVLYILYFVLGIYACRRQWFTTNGYSPKPLCWTIGAVLTGCLFMGGKIIFAKGTGLMTLAANAFLHTLFCLCAVLALISIFQRLLNSRSYLWRRLAANSYAIYYVHQFAVFSLNYALLTFPGGPFIKFFLSAGLAVIISYAVSELAISKLPVFGGKLKPDTKILPPTY